MKTDEVIKLIECVEEKLDKKYSKGELKAIREVLFEIITLVCAIENDKNKS